MKLKGLTKIVAGTALAGALAFGGGEKARGADVVERSFQQGVNGYNGTQDTYLSEGQDSIGGYGNYKFLANSSSQHGLLQFNDIFGDGTGQIPYGSNIVSANLSLRANETDSVNKATNLHRMLQPWNHMDTWNIWNGGIQANDIEAKSLEELSINEVFGCSNLNLNVTNSLQAWSNGENNYGWAFLANNDSFWIFDSSEAINIENRPKLTVTYPEPSTLGLLGAGAFGLATSRRRKNGN